jgi:hypothetical protein
MALTERKLGKKNQFEKQILANTPARFIKGNAAREYQQVYNASMAVGNGTEGRRAIVLKVLERMPEKENMVQRELKLPSVSRFVQ